MLDITTFIFIFIGACCFSIVVVHFLNRKAEPLRKAWNVYGAMSAVHLLLFMGLLLTLPTGFPLYGLDPKETDEIRSVDALHREVQLQAEDIQELKRQLNATRETLHWGLYLLTLFAPMLYYNMFKYNLRIEELSGKRMGSFD